jgi:Uma2 family endonuclease
MGTTARASIADFLNYKAPEGFRAELISGEIVLSPDPKPLHIDAAEAVARILQAIVSKSGGGFVVRQRTNIVMGRDDSMPSPDVFVIDRHRWTEARAANTYPSGSPQLAVEIMSPSNTQPQIRRKMELYLRNGAAAVWVVYPKKRTVLVSTQEEETEYRNGEVIPVPREIAPNAAVEVRAIFEDE